MEKDDVVRSYVSPVGNNDVPYPTAIGTKNVYFMLDKKLVSVEYLPVGLTKSQMNDLYHLFYGHNSSYPRLEEYARKMKGVKVIHVEPWRTRQ